MREGASSEGDHMRRKVFTIVSAVSLLMCVATSVMWFKSFNHPDYFIIWRTRTPGSFYIDEWLIGYMKGQIDIALRSSYPNSKSFPVDHSCNAYFVVAVFSVLPLLWAVAWNRNRKRKGRDQTLCIKCGYDLRATPHRCPECGRAVATEGTMPVR
jgi:hypothetical protein